MLILPIKKKWFDMILSGEKKEEYREIKQYYETRFQNLFGAITIYPSSIFSDRSKYELLRCRLWIGKGRPKWGASQDKQYYVLEILSVEKLAADKTILQKAGDS